MRAVETLPADGPEDPSSDGREVRNAWYRKLGIFLFIVVCFEVGAFLLVFPWTPHWDTNSIASLFPALRDYWDSSYFRGALSGLGLLNIYISLGEVSRLRALGRSRPRADRLRMSTL